jgi:alkylhydroperoxidase family enzyme
MIPHDNLGFQEKFPPRSRNMAHIPYLPEDEIPEVDRVPDSDHIIRIHGVNSRVMKQHYELYRALMYGKSSLTRIQREMVAVVVSSENNCHY